MHKKIGLLLAIIMLLTAIVSPTYAEASKATQYRVYQNIKPLKEFTSLASAKQYAAQFSFSHVEKITTNEWVWDNFPKYKVYIDGESTVKLSFATLNDAKAEAAKHKNSYVREIENIGYAYSNLPKYAVYQGEIYLPSNGFSTLEAAKQEAKKWANAQIIDLSNNQWIWDNISSKKREEFINSTAKYVLHQNKTAVDDVETYSFLKDAVDALNKLGYGEVYNIEKQKYVFSAENIYDVYVNNELIDSYSTLQSAIDYAKTVSLTDVKVGDKLFWSNFPMYDVYQNDKYIKSYFSLKNGLKYAATLANATVNYNKEKSIWTNRDKLIYLGWNGSSTHSVIDSHIANTQGLDIDSPTWYYLKNTQGELHDSSNADVVKQYANLGIDIIPLVHNQFDPKMTSEFLADKDAQTKFITALITSLKAINAKGLNLDFEEISSRDRQAFTQFVKQISEAAHKVNLTISIDLLRGDVSWNDRTAYDREAIAQYVDYVIIMAYDQHWRGSETAGSVAGIQWVEEGINQYLNYGIPRNKLILGVPFYVREWRIDGNNKLFDNRAVLMKNIDTIIAENNAIVTFDEKFGQNKVVYEKDGFTHVFWAETVDTVKARVQLAKKYDLAGVAAWRLGYEQSDVWDEILKLK